MSAAGVVAVRATVRGRVQGVWYRGWTEGEAVRRGLGGWVRNEPDGTVAALFVGAREAVDDMLAACRRGPPAARVDAVDVEDVEPPAGEATAAFRVLR